MRSRRRRNWSGWNRNRRRSSARPGPKPRRIITQSRADAERLREEMRQKARTEAEGIVRNAERQIQLETARAIQQIRAEAVDLSVQIASKIIQRNISKEDNERLIDDALKQVESRAH